MKIFFVHFFCVFLPPLRYPELGASGQKTNRKGAHPISRQLDQSFTEHGPAHPEQDPVFPTASPSHQEACTSLLPYSPEGREKKQEKLQAYSLQN